MHIVVFTGGDAPDPCTAEKYFLNNRADYVIACDSGVDTMELFNSVLVRKGISFTPDLLVGDWDSISDKSVLEKYRYINRQNFICDKDYSDTELALKHASGKGGFVTLVGAGGGKRIDHLFAVLDLFSTDIHPDVWICGEQSVYFIREKHTYTVTDCRADSPVSFFRLTEGRTYGSLKTEGLVWESDLFSKKGYLSLSNRIKSDYLEKGFTVKSCEGCFLLVTDTCSIVRDECQ